jgi:hypothetical protein
VWCGSQRQLCDGLSSFSHPRGCAPGLLLEHDFGSPARAAVPVADEPDKTDCAVGRVAVCLVAHSSQQTSFTHPCHRRATHPLPMWPKHAGESRRSSGHQAAPDIAPAVRQSRSRGSGAGPANDLPPRNYAGPPLQSGHERLFGEQRIGQDTHTSRESKNRSRDRACPLQLASPGRSVR